MRIVFLEIFFLIFIFGTNLSSEEINSWNELVRKGNIFYKKSDDQPFSGILKNHYPSGKLSLIDNFKNGKQHGEFKSFHENGEISMSGIFKNGKQHGQWIEFHEDGSIYWKLNYYDGVEEDGLFRTFHKNGEIMSEVTYLNGKPNSNWIHFDEGALDRFTLQLRDLKSRGNWTKKDLLSLYYLLLPDFQHSETGKYLDQRM